MTVTRPVCEMILTDTNMISLEQYRSVIGLFGYRRNRSVKGGPCRVWEVEHLHSEGTSEFWDSVLQLIVVTFILTLVPGGYGLSYIQVIYIIVLSYTGAQVTVRYSSVLFP